MTHPGIGGDASDSRIDEEYSCPSCGSSDTYSPTFNQRKCASCGKRGGAEEFRDTKQKKCPDCGSMAPKTHDTPMGEVYTCRSCYNQFEG